MPEESKVLGEQFARLDTRQSEFEKQVGQQLSELSTNVAGLTRAVNSMSRPQWQVWIGFASIIIVLVGAQNMYFKQAIINEAHTRNAMWAAQFRMNSMFWDASPLGKVAKYPQDNSYFPEPP